MQLMGYSDPQFPFAGKAVLVELSGDLIEGRLVDLVLGIAGKFRSYAAGQFPASPGPPASLFPPWFVHPVGQMLKMHPGIAHEHVRRGMSQKPGERGIGQGPVVQFGFVAAQIGAKGAVEFQDRPGHQTSLPEILAVRQCRQIKGRIPGVGVCRQHTRIHVFSGGRQKGTGRQAHAASVVPTLGRLKFNLAAGCFLSHKGGLQTGEPEQTINEVRGWRRAAVWLLALLVRTWSGTLRLEIDDESARILSWSEGPVAFVLWHNRLFVSPTIFRRYRGEQRLYALVSASRDGAWLAAFYRMINMHPVRGSSSNFGREAARALIEKLREGHDIGITPDGPRGPCYSVEPGVLVVTRRTNVPMIVFGAEFGPAWRLKSWDRLYLPRPFSRIKVRCKLLPVQDAAGRKLDAETLRNTLLEINPDPTGA
jgi:lysophospholipid acyltransferase (LPLAT)-like uncharacterized protein